MNAWRELERGRGSQAPRPDRPDVRVSDVASYAFCGRAWWLQRQERLDAGAWAHARVGAALDAWAPLRVLIWTAIGGAGVMVVVCVWLLTRR